MIWSGHPLSTLTRCEQTWIDGAKYFDRDEDMSMREDIAKEREALIQKILSADDKKSGDNKKPDGNAQPKSGRME